MHIRGMIGGEIVLISQITCLDLVLSYRGRRPLTIYRRVIQRRSPLLTRGGGASIGDVALLLYISAVVR